MNGGARKRRVLRRLRRDRVPVVALVPVALAGFWQALPAAAEVLPPERQRAILRDALNAFDDAVGRAREDPAAAEKLYRRSAAAFQTLLDSGVRNAALHYNLGNAYFRLGQLGRAIVQYRRAQRLDPTDQALAMNLTYARNRVEPFIPAGGGQQLVERLMFWTKHTSVRQRFWIASIASVGGWIGLAFRLRWRSRALVGLAMAGIGLGLANAGSVAWQLRDQAHRPAAVVARGEHVLRLGRGEGYDPALNQPLGPGVELRIINERGDWMEVELVDGKSGWLAASAVEKV